VDRAASEQMSALVEQLRADARGRAASINASAERTVWLGVLVMLASAVLVGLLSLWLVNRSLIEPIRQLIEYVAQLSQGRFAARVDSRREDELGRLARAANTLRDFLADTVGRLQDNARSWKVPAASCAISPATWPAAPMTSSSVPTRWPRPCTKCPPLPRRSLAMPPRLPARPMTPTTAPRPASR
jgi:HAMP domain-containing protein